jgi:transposase
LGIAEDRWTLRSLRQLCYEQTGQQHSQECIRSALHRLGQSWKRAKQTITSPDERYEEKRGQ